MSNKLRKRTRIKNRVEITPTRSGVLKVLVNHKYIFGIVTLLVALAFLGISTFYANFYHNELGKVVLTLQNSVIYVNKDGTFRWYREKGEEDKNVLRGIMRFYRGKAAYKMIDKHSDKLFNLSLDTVDYLFDENYSKEDFFVMTLDGVYFTEDNTKLGFDSSNKTIYLMGFERVRYLDALEYETGKSFQIQKYNSWEQYDEEVKN